MAKTPPKAPVKLSAAIRQAGEGSITKPDLKQIFKDTGKSSAQFVQKLDQINKNLKQNDNVGINLGSGATNMLIREASKQPSSPFMNAVMGPTLGTGKLGTEIQRRATEFGTTGSQGSLIPRGMQTMPSGRLTLPGVGPQFGPPKIVTKRTIIETRPKPEDKPDITDPITDPITPVTPITPITPITPTTPTLGDGPMTPEQMAEASSIAMGADINANAPGYRRKQSSRARAGRGAQGLAGATRVNPFGAWKSGKG